MSKTKLIIQIDTATLVDAVKHTNFTQAEQCEILCSLLRQRKLTKTSISLPSLCRVGAVRLWLSVVLIPFLTEMAKENPQIEIDKLIKQGEKALDSL